MNRRFALFFTTVLGIWAAMHLYVFLRLSSISWVAAHFSGVALVLIAAVLWASYPAARILNAHQHHRLGEPIELVAANWVGVLFILFWAFLATDVLTLGGWPFPEYKSQIRSTAVIAGLVLSAVGL